MATVTLTLSSIRNRRANPFTEWQEIQLSPDSKLLAATSGGSAVQLRLGDMATGEEQEGRGLSGITGPSPSSHAPV
jgi:hypothetical protein